MTAKEWFYREALDCGEWVRELFGDACADNPRERGLRLIEEAIEMGQALGVSRFDIACLIDQVYAKPVGELSQEAAGVLFTLLAACAAQKIDLYSAYCRERVRADRDEVKEKIKAKHAKKVRAVDAAPLESE